MSIERKSVTSGNSPLAEKLGILPESVGEDVATYRMAYRDDNTTLADVVHGGAILTLADCAATAAAWSVVEDRSRYRGLTIDLSLSFCAAARSADLRAHARVTRRGGTICFCDVEVVDEQHTLVAHAKVVYKLSRIATPQETMAGLFADRSPQEQMLLLAGLERTGADLYRHFAGSEADGGRRDELLASAAREEENAALLETIANEG